MKTGNHKNGDISQYRRSSSHGDQGDGDLILRVMDEMSTFDEANTLGEVSSMDEVKIRGCEHHPRKSELNESISSDGEPCSGVLTMLQGCFWRGSQIVGLGEVPPSWPLSLGSSISKDGLVKSLDVVHRVCLSLIDSELGGQFELGGHSSSHHPIRERGGSIFLIKASTMTSTPTPVFMASMTSFSPGRWGWCSILPCSSNTLVALRFTVTRSFERDEFDLPHQGQKLLGVVDDWWCIEGGRTVIPTDDTKLLWYKNGMSNPTVNIAHLPWHWISTTKWATVQTIEQTLPTWVRPLKIPPTCESDQGEYMLSKEN
ncbi:hypothetical protein Acr_05g0000340 [Actinidia rufa]|uniref:Uncharacterized protein n=1 Tax=Actinidia rufa TaxID=165716 RepID=A0A7J0EIU4_9ERIC|nr:hypothetical protein Acr_05g0000340 [Actinidia rufa]